MSNNEILSYPEELKQQFIEKGDIIYRDGTVVTASQIWKFMTEEAPKRFPYAFDQGINSPFQTLSNDVEYLSGIKGGYLKLSLKDFLFNAHKKGTPLIFVIGGQTMDPYYAAGGIAYRNAFLGQIARDMQEGEKLRKVAFESQEYVERGKSKLCPESCQPALRLHTFIEEEIAPIDLIAPYFGMRCSDMARVVEVFRDRYPTFAVDIPVEYENKQWSVDYLASGIHKLTQEISKLSGKKTTDKDVLDEIKLENKARKLSRDITELWWSAKVPPTNSLDYADVAQLATDFRGDPVAATGVLVDAKKEVKERIKHSIKGKGLDDDPIRLYVCGMGNPNRRRIDKAGGVVVGADQPWNAISIDIKESGDPYENIANGMLSLPQEQAIEKRADLAVEVIKKSRADGVLVLLTWGCNYQSAAVRMLADIIQERTGVPTNIFENDPGVEGSEQLENRAEAFIEILK